MGVNVTGAAGRGKPGRYRNEGLEVVYLMESSASRATLAEDGPAPAPGPPEDRLNELPPLTRRAIARLVASTGDMSAGDSAWCSGALAYLAANPTTPTPAADALRHVAGVLESLRHDTRTTGGGH